MEQNESSFVRNAAILTVAGFATRILGFIYRIILSNIIGAQGMGLFQLALPVYFIAASFLASGIPIAVSRMTAEQKAKGNYKMLPKIVLVSSVIAVTASIAISAVLFIYARPIAVNILHSPGVYYPMMVYIPALFITANSGVIRGFFQGIQNVVPQAIGQIVEQFARMALVLSLIRYAIGISIEYASSISVLGMVIGDVAGFITLMYFYSKTLHRYKKNNQFTNKTRANESSFHIGKSVISIALPISAGRTLTTLLQSMDSVLIPQRLQAAGYTVEQSLGTFGHLTGMAMPLLMFPSTITMSLSMTLLPAITEAQSLGKKATINYRAAESIKFTMMVSFAAASAFMFMPYQIGQALYNSQEVGQFLLYTSPLCLFFYVEGILAGILNGLGKQNITVANSVLCSLLRIACTYILVAIPSIEINGYIIGFIGTVILNTALNYQALRRFTSMPFDISNWLVKPSVSFIIMGACSSFIYRTMDNVGIPALVSLGIALFIGLSIYLLLNIRMGVVTIDEIKRFTHIK